MKVVLVSTSDFRGGAARAAFRLHQGLRRLGCDSQMLVQSRESDDPRVHAPEGKLARGFAALRPTLEQLPLRILAPAVRLPFSTQWFPDDVNRRLRKLQPQVVNLHWFHKGFLRIESLPRLPSPLVWTLHDMWAFTGGCHYAGDCDHFHSKCGACPQLNSRRVNDLSRWVWQRKQRSWQKADFTLVCPSRWLAGQASQSALFAGRRIEVIPNGIDLERYRPFPKGQARDWLRLPQDKMLILFSAMGGPSNPNKGFQYLAPVMQALHSAGWGDRLGWMLLGETHAEQIAGLPGRVISMGHLHDDLSLALVYAATDILIVPSLQDNLPNAAMEALACGTPCVAFEVGGIPEMVDHLENGYLAQPGDPQSLAAGLEWALGDDDRLSRLAQMARQKAVRAFDQKVQAARYLDLFQELTNPRRAGGSDG